MKIQSCYESKILLVDRGYQVAKCHVSMHIVRHCSRPWMRYSYPCAEPSLPNKEPHNISLASQLYCTNPQRKHIPFTLLLWPPPSIRDLYSPPSIPFTPSFNAKVQQSQFFTYSIPNSQRIELPESFLFTISSISHLTFSIRRWQLCRQRSQRRARWAKPSRLARIAWTWRSSWFWLPWRVRLGWRCLSIVGLGLRGGGLRMGFRCVYWKVLGWYWGVWLFFSDNGIRFFDGWRSWTFADFSETYCFLNV